MKTIIVSDLHEPPDSVLAEIEAMIAREAPERVVFLGDYFDQLGDTPGDVTRMARWLKASLADRRRTHLVGNHDASYLWPSPVTLCPGWEWPKQQEFSKTLDRTADRFAFHTWVDGWLLTHAGLSASWLPTGLALGEIDAWLTEQGLTARESFVAHQTHWFVSVGFSRGGQCRAGGILWCDHGELVPIPGLHQIYGHTPDRQPRWAGTDHLCLDTNLGNGPRHYAIVQDGRVEVSRFCLP